MSNYTETHLNIFSFQNENLQATFYKPTTTALQTIILYFHGGGFVFGSRNDLPKEYIEQLTATGIGIVAVDYPLAPETKLAVTLETTNKITKWFVEQFLVEQQLNHYFIMGRSAGAYLALANGVYTDQLANRPLGILSLYGYFTLNEASFTVPNRHYLKYPKVKDQTIAAQIQQEPLFESTDQNRYLLYLAARQKGDWLDFFLTAPDQKKKFSIDKGTLKQLPPLFLAAATKDPDVPTRQSRQLANLHDEATLHLVESDEHDFDRTHVESLGQPLYAKIGDWILALLD